MIIRQWQPVNGTEMEILSWVLAEKEASQDYKDSVLRNGFHNFGAAGVFEQDDMELWASATYASNNAIAKQYPLQLPYGAALHQQSGKDHKWPGRAFKPADTEVAQLEFMRQWDRCMKSNQ